jgi:hypothetical protein
MPARERGVRGVSFATVRKFALALPGVEEGTSYGTAAFRIKGKFFFRLREDGATLALRTTFADRDVLLDLDPRAFYVTDHYRDYPSVVVSLSAVRPAVLREVLEKAWRHIAPKTLVARFDDA